MKHFCLALFISLLTATAAAQNELQRIKQNFIQLTLLSNRETLTLKQILSSLTPETEMSDQAVIELHQHIPITEEKVRYYLSTLSDKGTWPDINYKDQKRSGWEPKAHAERILTLVKVFQTKESIFYHSKELETTVHKALHAWFTMKLVCPNWWYNQIGIPKTLGTAFLLFESHLTEKEKQQAIQVMKQSRMGMTGQNKVWLAGNVMMRAMLQNDENLIRKARDTIASEIVTGRKEGIQSDWSFHQHGTQQQFGNYGLSFVSNLSFYAALFHGTPLAFSQTQIEQLQQFISQGYRWILWKGKMDINALGRQLFHHAPIHKALSLMLAATQLNTGRAQNKYASSLRAMTEENYHPHAHNQLTGCKHFWQSDLSIYRSARWMASVKMSSTRVKGIESMNGDNMKGFYMADGATYVYDHAPKYLDVFPLWNWRKLPGNTALQSDAPMPEIKNSYEPRNLSSFAGGVSDGTQGASGMIINRGGVKAYKSWFYLDEGLLCLGAGIQSDSTLRVATTIEQCHQQGDLLIWQNKQWKKKDGVLTMPAKEVRLFHKGTGYVAWNGTQLIAESRWNTGNWHNIMHMYDPQSPSNQVKGKTMTITLEHGTQPKAAGYQYLILPATTPDKVSHYKLSHIKIIRNDSVAQIIYLPNRQQYRAVVYQPLELKIDKETDITFYTPGGYLIDCTSEKWHIWVADFSQQHTVCRIKINQHTHELVFPSEKGKSVHTIFHHPSESVN